MRFVGQSEAEGLMHGVKTILNWTSVLFLIIGVTLAVLGRLYGGEQGFGSIEQGEYFLPNGTVAAGYVLILVGAILMWLRVRIPSQVDGAPSHNTPTYSHLGKSTP